MLTLYDYLPSQNAYKIRLLLNHLSQPYETRLLSIFEGEGQDDAFFDISPLGAVPAIKLDDGRTLAESNAILIYLADETPFMPEDAYDRAKVLQWLFFEGETVQAGIATLRHWVQTGKDLKRPAELIESKQTLSLKTLQILDRDLAKNEFLGGQQYTIADMSVFAYVHLAKEANLPLDNFEHVARWINLIRQQDGFLGQTYPYSIDPHSAGEL